MMVRHPLMPGSSMCHRFHQLFFLLAVIVIWFGLKVTGISEKIITFSKNKTITRFSSDMHPNIDC